MKYKFKLTAIVLIIVIFLSTFFIGWNDYNTKNVFDLYPIFGNIVEEELLSSEVSFQILNINKSIYLKIGMSYILLLITIIASNKIFLYTLLTHETMQFYFYSVFIACFINKTDGKVKYIFKADLIIQ